MNKRWVLCLAALVPLSGCNRATDLAVRAVSGGEGAEATGRAQLEIRLLPYNRDSIFDALASMASQAEPQPPAALLALRDSVSVAQQRWRETEATWNEMRSELQDLADRMGQMNRSSNEYFQAYRRFDNLDAQVKRLDREKNTFFESFTNLQASYAALADSFTAVHTSWADAAFERYTEIVDSLKEARGREEVWDTTDAQGWALFSAPRGQWWLYTRFELPFEELYWNVPYQSPGGADTVLLSDSNAEVRPVF